MSELHQIAIESQPPNTARLRETTFLYRYFDADGRLLYVGIAAVCIRRITQHAERSHWFWGAVRMTIEDFPSREAALAAERHAIITERPLHNKMHRNAVPIRKAAKLSGTTEAFVVEEIETGHLPAAQLTTGTEVYLGDLDAWMARSRLVQIAAMSSPASIDVSKVRAKTGLTLAAFSAAYCIPVDTLQKWEQGRRFDSAATTLLRLIKHNPKAIADMLAAALLEPASEAVPATS